MADLAIASIAYNAPRAVSEQIRLLKKYLQDDYALLVVDQSTDMAAPDEIREMTVESGAVWQRPQTRLHHEGLNGAAEELLMERGMVLPCHGADYIGFLDHDVYPTKPTRLIPLIEEAGFLGVGQRHSATGHLYPWPGFLFFSREWLAGRPLDFTGISDKDPRNNGDTGSGLWPLFAEEDWKALYRLDHGYRALRQPDAHGLQSWGYEVIGDWIHITNASGWMRVPDREERDRLVYDLLASL